MNWNEENINLLDKIRINSIILSEKHRRSFFIFKRASNYFDLPVIILSTLGSSFAIGAQSYLSQAMISLVSCAVGIVVTIISSVKLYLNLDDRLKNELEISKNFYVLSIDIYKILNLNEKDKIKINAIEYLNEKYGEYIVLYNKSNLMRHTFKQDQLVGLPEGIELTPSNSSNTSTPRHISLEINEEEELRIFNDNQSLSSRISLEKNI